MHRKILGFGKYQKIGGQELLDCYEIYLSANWKIPSDSWISSKKSWIRKKIHIAEEDLIIQVTKWRKCENYK